MHIRTGDDRINAATKVLIADKFEQAGLDAMRAAGCDVVYQPDLKGDVLRDAIAETCCAVLVVRSTPVDADMLTAKRDLALVVRAGAGYNTIDVSAASAASVLVANCPGKNAVAVAELTFALMLALDRRVADNVIDLRAGKWDKKAYSSARGLKGRTLGIVGMGRIGKAVAVRARAFEMPVVAWSRSLDDETADEIGVSRCASAAEVASKCDVLSIHLASAPETKGLIDAHVLGGLRAGSYVINTARADVMDHDALAAAVKERGLRVALDVFPDEPSTGQGDFSPKILEAGGIIYGTHHIGASTDQAQLAIASEAVRIVTTFKKTGRVINCVNLRTHPQAVWTLTVRHLNKPGVLAHVLHELSYAGINVEEMENTITTGGAAACAHIHLDAGPPPELLDRVTSGSPHVLAVALTAPATQ